MTDKVSISSSSTARSINISGTTSWSQNLFFGYNDDGLNIGSGTSSLYIDTTTQLLSFTSSKKTIYIRPVTNYVVPVNGFITLELDVASSYLVSASDNARAGTYIIHTAYSGGNFNITELSVISGWKIELYQGPSTIKVTNYDVYYQAGITIFKI